MMWWEGVKMVYHWTLGKKEKWWPKKGRYFPGEIFSEEECVEVGRE